MHDCANHILRSCSRSTAIVLFSSIISLFTAVAGYSQDSIAIPSTRQELWPELDFYYRLNDKLRLFGSYSSTQLRTSSYTDGGISVNVDYFAMPLLRDAESRADSSRGHFLWFRGGFSHSYSPKDASKSFREYNVLTEMSFLLYLPYKFMLIEKNRFDWRWRDGDFQPRYRPRLTLERAFKTDFLTFKLYAYGEYFLNFDPDANNRLRLAVGWEVRASKRINLETYFVHQFEGDLEILSVNAVGITGKFFFNKNEPLFSKKKISN